MRFPRQGNYDAEGDWYERGRKRLARCRLICTLLVFAAVLLTIANAYLVKTCG